MFKNKISVFIVIAMLLLFYSCDPAYNLSFIIDNKSNDTIYIDYSYPENNQGNDTSVTVLPNERKTFLIDFIIGFKASKFGDCCPCKFSYIKANDSTIEVSNSSKWTIEKQNKDKNHDDGYVNCIFTK